MLFFGGAETEQSVPSVDKPLLLLSGIMIFSVFSVLFSV